MADEIVFVQSLHDDDDGAVLVVVELAVEGVVEPIIGLLALRIGECLLRLQRIIDYDHVGSPSGQYAAIRGGEPISVGSGQKLANGLAVRGEAGRKEPLVPPAHHDCPAIAGELVGKILTIADAEDLRRGIMPEAPGREGNRGHQGFEMARRQINDQPLDFAVPYRGQLGADHIDVPVHRECRLRIELRETALSKKRQSRPQDRIIFGGQQVSHLGSLVLAAELGLDPLDDLSVGLGNSRWISGARVAPTFNLAEQRQQLLSGLRIARG